VAAVDSAAAQGPCAPVRGQWLARWRL